MYYQDHCCWLFMLCLLPTQHLCFDMRNIALRRSIYSMVEGRFWHITKRNLVGTLRVRGDEGCFSESEGGVNHAVMMKSRRWGSSVTIFVHFEELFSDLGIQIVPRSGTIPSSWPTTLRSSSKAATVHPERYIVGWGLARAGLALNLRSTKRDD